MNVVLAKIVASWCNFFSHYEYTLWNVSNHTTNAFEPLVGKIADNSLQEKKGETCSEEQGAIAQEIIQNEE